MSSVLVEHIWQAEQEKGMLSKQNMSTWREESDIAAWQAFF
jgi:hypothetical protein